MTRKELKALKSRITILSLFAAILIAGIMIMSSCGSNSTKTHQNIRIHTYTTTTKSDLGGDEILYWYLIVGSNNNYYYYSSPTQVSNFSTVTWVTSTSKPAQLEDAEETEMVEIPANEISQPEVAEQAAEQATVPNEEPETNNTENTNQTTNNESEPNSTNESNSESSSSEGSGSSDGGGGGD